MSDDEADPELLELLRQSLGLSKTARDEISKDTGTYIRCIYVEFDRWHLIGDPRSRSEIYSKDVSDSIAGVLKDAQFIYNNAIDISIDMHGTRSAAQSIYAAMQERTYSTRTWGQHELHPSLDEGFTEIEILNFVFTLDLLNFSYGTPLH